VVQTIEEMIGGHTFFSLDSGRAKGGGADLSFADIAVLYRAEAQAAALCEALARSGIPFKHHAHASLAADAAVRALLQELESDGGDQPLAVQLRAAADRLARGDAAALDAAALDQAAIITAWQRLNALAEGCKERAHLFDAIALSREDDFFDPRADRVSLLTLHAAKGLEFRVVFIVGLEDGILPLHWGAPEEAALTEERRLFYVGMTRAKDRLILSRAARRRWRGRLCQFPASPFLAAIEAALLNLHAQPLRRKQPERQLKLL